MYGAYLPLGPILTHGYLFCHPLTALDTAPPHLLPPPLKELSLYLLTLLLLLFHLNVFFSLLFTFPPILLTPYFIFSPLTHLCHPPPFFSLFFLTLLSSWSDSPPLFSPQFPSPSSPHRALCLPPTPPRWRRPPRKRRSRSHARIRNRIRGGAGAGSLTGCSSPYARRWGRPSPSSSSEP